MMYFLVVYFFLFSSQVVHSAEQTEHRDFQYNSVVDPMTGRYNFAYDTGNDNGIAHNLHMQYRDANGIVRGRYGYTDPRGKLRIVEYEAGPNGFVARGDVGPDRFPHDNAPDTQVPQFARYSQEDLQLVPRPVQMAGWDPLQAPMGQPVSSDSTSSSSQGEIGVGTGAESSGLDGYETTNNTNSGDADTYVLPINPYSERYPRMYFSMNENMGGRELESLSAQTSGNENKSDVVQDYPVAAPLTVNDIDQNPDDIRVAANQGPVERSADGDRSRYSRALPYSYRNYQRQTHDHDAETTPQGSGYRVVYRSYHDHYNEPYYRRQTHDHDAEKKIANNRQTHDHDAERRYYVINRQTHDHDAEKKIANNRQTHDHDAERRYYISNRQTHDHDAERRYVSNRQTHDHDAERRYYISNRQTHDHDAERRYYVNNRQTHDHDAERRNYYRRVYYQNSYPYRRRIYYRDNHSMVPHEHYSDIYHNDRSHQHSDIHLYGKPQNLQVPATARPNQLKYISSDKYHDKYYYWTD